ncbi:PPOX class F420-dependent oxidoreductase [Actinophytocola gossypii]|uniref:PPOX class F420-dependent oxidoreductase n=1 Tax=Actinophytocola gossypii TaxID=2812003 RepID=A0ABT2JK56_9PSEU|nr:PPOX class F420-dependent oxidoreductase [Actinophytocola gossypii]MCT2588123.1 PPOX class F420-dependent oxidoreductase [Actinophytocola gossypii]
MTNTETTTGFEHLAGAKYILLTTFRRDGTPVATPVWHAVRDGIVYTSTIASLGKVKRIRRDPHVTIAPCTIRGRPTGPAQPARARILSGEESRWANRIKRSRYLLGIPIQLVERIVHRERFVGIAIEPVR